MKRYFTVIILLVSLCSSAQIKTYSSCDTNTDDDVTVTDVTNTVNKVVGKAAAEQNMVTAEQLNTVLSDIYSKLESNAEQLQILKECLSSIASKVGALTPEEIELQKTHVAVDLGLSVKWATFNVGAAAPEDYGQFFAWGDTDGYTSDISDGHSFVWKNYSLSNGTNSSMTKYCATTSYGTMDALTVLEASDDAAAAHWGGDWRMPTSKELGELVSSCEWTWTTLNDVCGYKVTGTNGNSIFLPAAGYRDSGLNDQGTGGCYWSSSLNTVTSCNAFYLIFDSSSYKTNSRARCYGFSIRPVCK